eukprot:961587-Prorocentrum_minimum.AAC.1
MELHPAEKQRTRNGCPYSPVPQDFSISNSNSKSLQRLASVRSENRGSLNDLPHSGSSRPENHPIL